MTSRVSAAYYGPSWLRSWVQKYEIKYFHRAVDAYLFGAQFTDKTVEELSKLKHLKSITVNGTKITDEGLDLLRRRLPDCKVERQKSSKT